MDPIEKAAEEMAKELCQQLVGCFLCGTIENGHIKAVISDSGVQFLKGMLVKVAEIGLIVGKEPTNVDPGPTTPGTKPRLRERGLSPDEPIGLDLGALIER